MHGGHADEAQRAFVLALWTLLRTAASRLGDAAVRECAEACCARFAVAHGGAPHYVLQLRAGSLHGNGSRIRPDTVHFAAIAEVVAMLQRLGVSDLLLLADAGAADFATLAIAIASSERGDDFGLRLLQGGCSNIQVAQDPGVEFGGDGEAPRRAVAPSQLGAVFTMQRLAQAIGRRGPLAGRRARTILQDVLHRMLRRPEGLLPLARLPQAGPAVTEAVNACVLAVRAAERLDWPQDRGLDAGGAALLGSGLVRDVDVSALQLGAAAASVASLLAAAERPGDAIDRVQAQGAATDEVCEAMELVLTSG